MKTEVARLKLDCGQKQITIDELTTRLELIADADKTLVDLRQQLAEKDRTILALRASLDEAVNKLNAFMSGSSDRDQALLALQKKYDDALDHTLTLQLQI